MKEYKLLLPIAKNDKSPIRQKDWSLVRNRFLSVFGGYTEASSHSNGAWRNEKGETFKDTVKTFFLASENVETIRETVKGLDGIFQQESYFLAETSNNVSFINPKE